MTSRKINYKEHVIEFHKFDELGYRLYDERGKRVPYSTLDNRGGEFVLIPEEKIKK